MMKRLKDDFGGKNILLFLIFYIVFLCSPNYWEIFFVYGTHVTIEFQENIRTLSYNINFSGNGVH